MPLPFAARIEAAQVFSAVDVFGLEIHQKRVLPALWTVYHVHHGDKQLNPG